MEKFENGEYFIYVNGDINGRYELGKVKRPNNNGTGYFCWYHTGDTCANTPVECMHKLVNAYVIIYEKYKDKLADYDYTEGLMMVAIWEVLRETE